jgi:hypothetical protein
VLTLLQVNQQITITFPDLSTVTFWGWLDTFTPGDLSEGEQPTAEITVIPSNQDSAGDEVGLSYADNAPDVPASLTSTDGSGIVTLTWDSATGDDAYNVYRTQVSGEGYVLVAQNIVSNTFVDNSVTNAETYYYVIRAIANGVLSDASAEHEATPTA